MLPIEQYLSVRDKARGLHVMHQSWRDLLFLHYSADPEEIQATLPAGLTVDTYPDATGQERAWVGLIPFRMIGVRARAMPPLPAVSAFPETNVRTYVHRNGQEPGIWFYSLDAAQWLACQTARATYGLPYYHAEMAVARAAETVTYTSRRNEGRASHEISARIGEDMGFAEPGTLEFFLVERYLLYSQFAGTLRTAQVCHPPYPLRSAEVLSAEECMLEACSLPSKGWEHVIFSEGVDVDIYALSRAPKVTS